MIMPEIELLTPQSHGNIAVIPLKTPKNYLDMLTLKKGIELGLVEVKECEQSTVNTLIVKNNAVTPLLLVDGEEVIGGDQNRIINSTMIIAPQSETKVSVSCSERGRWAYKDEFRSSVHIADYNTRRRKMHAIRHNRPVQSEVWASIDSLEERRDFRSPTSAMSESYENKRIDLNEMIKSFEIVDGQTGILIIANGEIKGFEILLNSEIYRDFHEKILKSYLIDVDDENSTFTIDTDMAKAVIGSAMDCEFEQKPSFGLEKSYEFENENGFGKVYEYEDSIVHFSYFKNLEDVPDTEDAPIQFDVDTHIRD